MCFRGPRFLIIMWSFVCVYIFQGASVWNENHQWFFQQVSPFLLTLKLPVCVGLFPIVGVNLNSETSLSLRKINASVILKNTERGEKRETTKKQNESMAKKRQWKREKKKRVMKYLIALYNTECLLLAYNPMLLDYLPTPKKDQYKLNW